MPDTEEQPIEEAAQAADATADELGERSDRLGEQIEDSKRTHEEALNSEKVPTAANDWEDSEPEDSADDDPTGAGFDDPEDLDLDEEDLDEDDAHPDDEEE